MVFGVILLRLLRQLKWLGRQLVFAFATAYQCLGVLISCGDIVHIKATGGASDFGPSEMTKRRERCENLQRRKAKTKRSLLNICEREEEEDSLLFQVVLEGKAAAPEQVITKRVRICR
jgi:hypothetical protein